MSTHLFPSGSCKEFIASLCNVFVSVALLTSLKNSLFDLVLDVFSFSQFLALSSLGTGSLSYSLCSSSCYCDFKLSSCKWLLLSALLMLFLLRGCFLMVLTVGSFSLSASQDNVGIGRMVLRPSSQLTPQKVLP